MFDHAFQRLRTLVVLPELQTMLEHMVGYDASRLGDNQQWAGIIPAIQHILGANSDTIAPFAEAWCAMYAASVRLDHLQDGDPHGDARFAALPPPIQYNLVFSYYTLATHALDDLSPARIPEHRIRRVRRMWSERLLRMASGQHRDLVIPSSSAADRPLAVYEDLARCKTGAVFALAFGGVAALHTDDPQMIEALTLAGEIYGMLLQYSDDVIDAAEQANCTLTLPHALIQTRPDLAGPADRVSGAFWEHLYQAYYRAAAQVLAGLPAHVQHGILTLFDTAFGVPAATQEVGRVD